MALTNWQWFDTNNGPVTMTTRQPAALAAITWIVLVAALSFALYDTLRGPTVTIVDSADERGREDVRLVCWSIPASLSVEEAREGIRTLMSRFNPDVIALSTKASFDDVTPIFRNADDEWRTAASPGCREGFLSVIASKRSLRPAAQQRFRVEGACGTAYTLHDFHGVSVGVAVIDIDESQAPPDSRLASDLSKWKRRHGLYAMFVCGHFIPPSPISDPDADVYIECALTNDSDATPTPVFATPATLHLQSYIVTGERFERFEPAPTVVDVSRQSQSTAPTF